NLSSSSTGSFIGATIARLQVTRKRARNATAAILAGRPRQDGGEPGRERVEQQPGSPCETRQTVDPAYPISREEEHDEEDEDPMRQQAVRPVGRRLGLARDGSSDARAQTDGQNRQDEREQNIGATPPCREGGAVGREPCGDRERSGNSEHDRSRDREPSSAECRRRRGHSAGASSGLTGSGDR